MGDIVGHFISLTEAKKLGQSQLIPGVFPTDIKRNNPLAKFPVALAQGTSIKWNEECTVLSARRIASGTQLDYQSGMQYTQQEIELKQYFVGSLLNKFIKEVYGTINNYEAITLMELQKGMLRTLGDALIYDDTTYDDENLSMDGLHAWAATKNGTDSDQDNGEAGLSLANVRTMIDAMPYGCSAIWTSYEIWRRISQAYEEVGFAALATGEAGAMSVITRSIDEIGKRIYFFDGIPFEPTDFLVAEQANTGIGSDARAVYSSGDKQYSIFGVLYGDVFRMEPGVTIGFGSPNMLGDFFEVDLLDKMESYNTRAMRLFAYPAVLRGSPLSLARIYDIEDVAVTA